MTSAASPTDRDQRDAANIQRACEFLRRKAAEAFFGKVTFSLQSGRVCDVRIEQVRKPDEL